MYRIVGLSTHQIVSAVELLKLGMLYVERSETWNVTQSFREKFYIQCLK